MTFLFSDVAQVSPDKTGRKLLIPCLVNGDNKPVVPLLKYFEFLLGKGRSQRSLIKIRESVRLFFDYSHANIPAEGFGLGEKGLVRHWEHFARFRDALVHGTMDSSGEDPSGLYWLPSSPRKGAIVIACLTDFFQHIEFSMGESDVGKFNPKISPLIQDAFVKASAYEFARSKAFLGHTWTSTEDRKFTSYAVEGGRFPTNPQSDAKRISDSSFLRLLEKGFDCTTEPGMRNALIAILMNKGGLRISEALHLWVVDISEDVENQASAYVQVVHPDHGPCGLNFKGRRFDLRSDYLMSVYNLAPRTRIPSKDSQSLGWKAKFSALRVYWFEDYWGEIFWRLWRRYFTASALIARNHPYAFTMRHGNTYAPLTETAYRKAFERAVHKAGLIPNEGTSLKNSGLTPHGCRHAYGNRAKNEGKLDEKIVMLMMHHSSTMSQEVYTTKSHVQVLECLKAGMKRLNLSEDDVLNAEKACHLE